jgi:hypothetical protein
MGLARLEEQVDVGVVSRSNVQKHRNEKQPVREEI